VRERSKVGQLREVARRISRRKEREEAEGTHLCDNLVRTLLTEVDAFSSLVSLASTDLLIRIVAVVVVFESGTRVTLVSPFPLLVLLGVRTLFLPLITCTLQYDQSRGERERGEGLES
jgi:hypothetical protein